MLNNEIMRDAVTHYAKTHDLTNFKYDGLKGVVAFDYYLFSNEEFLIAFWIHFLAVNLFCGEIKNEQSH